MQYLGGKARYAEEIANVVRPRGLWWDPFCGGLSVAVQLAKHYPVGLVSDANHALIALYQGVRAGWQPPSSMNKADYERAKTLADTDPLKAFAGVACSFQAKWFGGFVGEAGYQTYQKRGMAPAVMWVDKPGAAAKALKRDLPQLSSCVLASFSFFALDPDTAPCPEVIYADPPYLGTTVYGGVAPFDHGRFWEHCQRWSARGVRVFVSEYACPLSRAEVVWEKPHRTTMNLHERVSGSRIERVFAVPPASLLHVA